MSPSTDGVHGGGTGFPRVSGDEPLTAGVTWWRLRFSPRERG